MTRFENLHKTNFHADLIERVVSQLNEGEDPDAYLYRLSATFDDSSVFRHLDFLSLRGAVLTMIHVDELPVGVRWYAHMTSVHKLGGMELGSLEAHPDLEENGLLALGDEGELPDDATHLTLFLPISISQSIELGPLQCDDPTCDADHGLGGTLKDEGLMLSFSGVPEESSTPEEVLAFVGKVWGALEK